MTKEIKDTDIITIDLCKHVRLRPGMYFGGVDQRALHQLVWEVLNDAAEEIMAGSGDHIRVTLKTGNEISIRDNACGIPVHVMENHKKKWLERYLTEVDKSGVRRGDPFQSPRGGLMDVGLRAVNAVSSTCTAEVAREGYLWKQSYKEGIPQSKVIRVRALDEREATGTTITFTPDYTVFDHNDFQYELIVQRARELAYLIPRVTLVVRDERESLLHEERFYFPNGLTDLVHNLNQGHLPLHDIISGGAEWVDKNSKRQVKVDFALQYTDSMETIERSYANTIATPAGGTHLAGIWSALMAIINQYAVEAGDVPFTQAEIAAGLTIAVSVQLQDVSFENQYRIKLINPDIFEVVASIVQLKFIPIKEDLRKEILYKCQSNRQTLRAMAKDIGE